MPTLYEATSANALQKIASSGNVINGGPYRYARGQFNGAVALTENVEKTLELKSTGWVGDTEFRSSDGKFLYAPVSGVYAISSNASVASQAGILWSEFNIFWDFRVHTSGNIMPAHSFLCYIPKGTVIKMTIGSDTPQTSADTQGYGFRFEMMLLQAHEGIPPVFVEVRATDRSLTAGQNLTVTPNLSTAIGDKTLINGNNFVAPRDGLYAYTFGPFQFNNTGIAEEYTVANVNSGNVLAYNSGVGIASPVLSGIVWFQKNEWVNCAIISSVAQSTILSTAQGAGEYGWMRFALLESQASNAKEAELEADIKKLKAAVIALGGSI
jgi:hypothetical protein